MEAAKIRYRRRMQELDEGLAPTDLSNAVLQRVSELFLAHRRGRISPGSHNAEKSIVRNVIRLFGGNRRLRSLADIAEIERYENSIGGVAYLTA